VFANGIDWQRIFLQTVIDESIARQDVSILDVLATGF